MFIYEWKVDLGQDTTNVSHHSDLVTLSSSFRKTSHKKPCYTPEIHLTTAFRCAGFPLKHKYTQVYNMCINCTTNIWSKVFIGWLLVSAEESI